MKVRINNPKATPYLRQQADHIEDILSQFPKRHNVCVDLGSGNGRNAAFVQDHMSGFYKKNIYRYDLHPDVGVSNLDLNRLTTIPKTDLGLRQDCATLILCQYILMFLSGFDMLDRVSVLVDQVSRPGACLVVELYQNQRTGLLYEGVQDNFRDSLEDLGWAVEHEKVDHFLMRKIS